MCIRISTDKQLQRLKPGEYPVAAVPGMSVRVSSKGRKSFRLRYRIFPKPKQHSLPLGRYPDISLKDATASAKIAIGDAAKGKDPCEVIRAARQKSNPEMFFDALVERYSQEWCSANYKARTAKEKIELLYREWGKRAKFARLDVRAITPEMIVEHLSAISMRGHHDANALSNLSTFFKWLYGQRIISVIPTDGIPHNSKAIPRTRVLNHTELQSVWQAANEIGYPFGHIVQLLLLTATRRDEVAGMQWSELDYNCNQWTIPHERTKKQRKSTAQPQIVPLSQLAQEVLLSVPKTDEVFVFPGGRGNKHVTDWACRKAELDRLSGVSGFTLHDLRRTVATELGRLKVPPHIKKAILHHSSRDVMDLHYDRWEYIDEKREALENWAHDLSRIVHV